MKLRFLVIETDHGPYKPSGPPYSMTLGKPWTQFRRSQPRLQYQGPDGEWIEVEVVVVKKNVKP